MRHTNVTGRSVRSFCTPLRLHTPHQTNAVTERVAYFIKTNTPQGFSGLLHPRSAPLGQNDLRIPGSQSRDHGSRRASFWLNREVMVQTNHPPTPTEPCNTPETTEPCNTPETVKSARIAEKIKKFRKQSAKVR